MRTVIVATLLLMLRASCMALGQSTDADDSLQVGYAIITPLGATTNAIAGGMSVFETFRLTDGNNTWQVGVLPPDMLTNGVLFVDYSRRLSRNLGVVIANPASTNTNVTMSLRRSDGIV